ncbi:MAG TPA: hypothetical protein VJ951_09125, partial [Bacteroidales bacterium]|nr:hypothetical protein [Bacteroidales bacterium]
IGIGGIMDATDAIEFILAGASAVQVGTSNFVDPNASVKMVKGIDEYLERHNHHTIKDITGGLQL